MGIFKAFWAAVGIVLVLGMAALTYATRTPDPRTWWAAIQVWRLNRGQVSTNDFDWHLLVADSTGYGARALRDLQQYGASDDIRIAADYVLDSHVPGCTDPACRFDIDMKAFKPVPRAAVMVSDLKSGQVLPHDFVVATANTLRWCGPKAPDCVLRMQDFNDDGHDEVYVEITRRDSEGSPEDETRVIDIYTKDKDGWWRYPMHTLLVNFDARSFPQRPFVVEPSRMDLVSLDGTLFNFAIYPHYRVPGRPVMLQVRAAEMKSLGAQLAAVPVVFPQSGKVPDSLGRAMTSGAVAFTPLVANPLLPVPYADSGAKPAGEYTSPSSCRQALDCRAIVADLDHDGHDEVVLISNGPSDQRIIPGEGTLFKSDDGKTWRVAANIKLCQELVPDVTKAKIAIAPPSEWGQIRLAQDLYPIHSNPWCDNGFYLE